MDLLLISTCQHFTFKKKLLYALTPKDLDKQSFFIVNGGKARNCHPQFINRAGTYYLYFINEHAGRCHPSTTIERVMCRW